MHRLATALVIVSLGWTTPSSAQQSWLEMTSSCYAQLPWYKFTLTGLCSLDFDNISAKYPSRYDELSVDYRRDSMSNLNETAKASLYGDETCLAAIQTEECSTLFSSVMCFNALPPCIYCSTYYDELVAECPNSYAACLGQRQAQLEEIHGVESLFNQYSCEGSGWRWRGRFQLWIEPHAERCKNYAVDAWPDGCVKDDGSVFDANASQQASSASSMLRGGGTALLVVLAALV